MPHPPYLPDAAFGTVVPPSPPAPQAHRRGTRQPQLRAASASEKMLRATTVPHHWDTLRPSRGYLAKEMSGVAAGGPPALPPPLAPSGLDSDPRQRRGDYPRPKCRAHEGHRLPHTIRCGRCITAEESRACWAAPGAPTPLARLEIVAKVSAATCSAPLGHNFARNPDPPTDRSSPESACRRSQPTLLWQPFGTSASRDHRVPRQRSALAVRAHQAAAKDGRLQNGYVALATAWPGPVQATVTTRRTRRCGDWVPARIDAGGTNFIGLRTSTGQWGLTRSCQVGTSSRCAVTLSEHSPRQTQDAAWSGSAAATGVCHSDRDSYRGTGGARTSDAAAVGLCQAPPGVRVTLSCRLPANDRHVM